MSSASSANDIDPIDVSILVVSYNTRALTLAALHSVAAETRRVRYELIVVDNASTDGSADAIAAHPDRPQFIALPDNIGFARASNLAARQANGRYILLLNPDTVVLDGAIDALLAFADANPGPRVWGGRTLYADRTLNPASCWAMMTPWSLLARATGLASVFPGWNAFNPEAYGSYKRDRVRAVDIVSGCFLLMARADWDRLGGFDPVFFMYGEDADLCLRARALLGAQPMITPAATILHYGGASEKVRADKMVRLLAAKASLIRRHFPAYKVRLGLALLAAWPLSRRIACRTLAALTGGARWRDAAVTWALVRARRAEWRDGFAPKSVSRGRGTLAAAGEPGAPLAPNFRVPLIDPDAPSGGDGSLIGAHLTNPFGLARVIDADALESVQPRYTIATLVTDPVQYAAMQASFVGGGFTLGRTEYLAIDNRGPRQTSAARGLSAALTAASGDIVILCHQDVRLIRDGACALDQQLAQLSRRDPTWALAGNAGGVGPGRLAIRISDPHGANVTRGPLPARVAALDENFIVVRRSANVGFSADLEGFHFYGADLCLNASMQGRSAWVIDFHLHHLSPGRKDANFWRAQEAFRRRWSHALRPRLIQTTCSLVWLSGSLPGALVMPLLERPLAAVLRRFRRFTAPAFTRVPPAESR